MRRGAELEWENVPGVIPDGISAVIVECEGYLLIDLKDHNDYPEYQQDATDLAILRILMSQCEIEGKNKNEKHRRKMEYAVRRRYSHSRNKKIDNFFKEIQAIYLTYLS